MTANLSAPVLEQPAMLEPATSPDAKEVIMTVEIVDHKIGLDEEQLAIIGSSSQVQVSLFENDALVKAEYVDTLEEAEQLKASLLGAK